MFDYVNIPISEQDVILHEMAVENDIRKNSAMNYIAWDVQNGFVGHMAQWKECVHVVSYLANQINYCPICNDEITAQRR